MIVLDASAAVRALIGDRRVRASITSVPVRAPHLIDAEVANTLRGLTLGRRICESQAAAMLARWPLLGVVRFAMHPLLARMWELRPNLTAYDAAYVALAEELECPLMTVDARVAGAAGITCEVTVLPS